MLINQFSCAGAQHGFDSDLNQDVINVLHDGRYVAVSLADGVSTCSMARQGAVVACNTINDLLISKARSVFENDEKKIAKMIISQVLCSLTKQADDDNRDVTDYSSTISSVLIDKKTKHAALINLGDGMIFAIATGKINVLALPEDSSAGCCVTTTQNAYVLCDVKTIDLRILDYIVICSDGAWREMFNRNRMKPEVLSILVNGEYDGLKDLLLRRKDFDDFSVVAVNLKEL